MQAMPTRYNSYDCATDPRRTFSPADLAEIADADREINDWFIHHVHRDNAGLKHIEQCKAYNRKNRDAYLAYQAAYRERNRVEIRRKNRERRAAGKAAL